MNKNFRENVQKIAQKGIDILDKYFDGGPADTARVNNALRALTMGVKIEHMDQNMDLGNKRIALKVFQYLPKEGNAREKYLKLTHPEVKPLLPRPRK